MMTIVPRATNLAIQRALESDPEDPLKLDRHFIAKLIRKIREERKHRFVGEQAERALAEFQDKKNAIVEQMWKILLSQSAKEDVKIAAARTILEAEDRFLSKQMDAGIFERNLGTVRFKATLTEERKIMILQAFKNWGIVKGEIPQLIEAAKEAEKGNEKNN
jgi:hypothetical protein